MPGVAGQAGLHGHGLEQLGEEDDRAGDRLAHQEEATARLAGGLAAGGGRTNSLYGRETPAGLAHSLSGLGM
ncbi:hypothetical protein ACF05T_14940 [Streptomyces lateritius]|uniref:Uncharacterized protein n=1 Tax=Streptomyces lateritius TaxID=67313 RepID=A0ABW6YC32_9ACTN